MTSFACRSWEAWYSPVTREDWGASCSNGIRIAQSGGVGRVYVTRRVIHKYDEGRRGWGACWTCLDLDVASSGKGKDFWRERLRIRGILFICLFAPSLLAMKSVLWTTREWRNYRTWTCTVCLCGGWEASDLRTSCSYINPRKSGCVVEVVEEGKKTKQKKKDGEISKHDCFNRTSLCNVICSYQEWRRVWSSNLVIQ